MPSICLGCGLELAPVTGPTDPYGGSSPACWALYGELLVREFSDREHFAAHGTSVDAYMVQHATRTSRAAVQSLWVHLAGLCVVLERGAKGAWRAQVLSTMASPKREFGWLTPPPIGSALTLASVRGADEAEAHARRVREWATSVWGSWSAHHERVRAEVDAVSRGLDRRR